MDITPPNDSAMLKGLIVPADQRLALSRPLAEVQASPHIKSIHPDEEGLERQMRRPSRRKKERRQRQASTLLDTRTPEDRRQSLTAEDEQFIASPLGQELDVRA